MRVNNIIIASESITDLEVPRFNIIQNQEKQSWLVKLR